MRDYIEYRPIRTPLGYTRHEWQWNGDSESAIVSPFTSVSAGAFDWDALFSRMRPGKRVWIGPFNVRAIEKRPELGGWEVRRGSRLTTAIAYALYRGTRIFREVNVRILLTLHVWGLAEHEMHTIPSWSDIKFVKCLRR